MIGGACVLVRLYQTWAGHQGNENPVAIDEIKRIQWLEMMRKLASPRDIILEGGQNRHEMPADEAKPVGFEPRVEHVCKLGNLHDKL